MNTMKTFMTGCIGLFLFCGIAAAAENTNAVSEPAQALANQEAKPADSAKEEAKPADAKEAGGPLVDAVKAEIKNKSKTSGTLDIFDNKTQKVRTLDVIGLKETAKDTVTGDFRDTKTGDVVTVEVKVADNKVGDFNITKAEPPKPVQTAKKDYTDQELQDFMKEYISTQAAGTGTFQLFDEKTQKMRKMEFIKLQEKVRRYGIIGISTAEFKEKDTGDTILADMNVENKKEGLEVTAVRIKSIIKAGGSVPADASAATPAPAAGAASASASSVPVKK
jgi:hypothetical protein